MVGFLAAVVLGAFFLWERHNPMLDMSFWRNPLQRGERRDHAAVLDVRLDLPADAVPANRDGYSPLQRKFIYFDGSMLVSPRERRIVDTSARKSS
jgi:hypothetical protein